MTNEEILAQPNHLERRGTYGAEHPARGCRAGAVV